MPDRHAPTRRHRPAGGAAGRDTRPVLVLHVGMHKTGSTSLQDFLSAHVGQLAAAGFVYPEVARFGNQHAALPAAYMDQHPALPSSLLNRDPQSVLQEILESVPGDANVLLSSEVFWELATYLRPAYSALVDLLRQHWDVRTLYVARDPHQKAWSSIKHMAREGRAFDPIETYRADVGATVETERYIRDTDPTAVRIPYDGDDTVKAVLAALAGHEPPCIAPLDDAQRAALRTMIGSRGPQRRRDRGNRDFSSPVSAAVTMAISETLSLRAPTHTVPLTSLARLHLALFRTPAIGAVNGLPMSQDLESRVQRAAHGPILTQSEHRALTALMRDHRVRARAALSGCTRTLRAITTELADASSPQRWDTEA